MVLRQRRHLGRTRADWRWITIVPCHNSEHTIVRALDSISNQTRRPTEVVVVDDGSTDGTSEMVQCWISDNRHISTRLVGKSNGGVASARNLGMSVVPSDVVNFLDADDTLLPHAIEYQWRVLRQSSASAAYGDAYLGNQSDRRARLLSTYVRQPPRLALRHVLNDRPIPLSTVAIKTRVLNSLDCFDEQLSGCEDYDLWFRMLRQRKRIAFIGAPIAFLSVTPNAGSADLERYRKAMTEVLTKLRGEVPIYRRRKINSYLERLQDEELEYPQWEQDLRTSPDHSTDA